MKIIYLKPVSGFKTIMRSDTLWGKVCWAIRMVYGNASLEAFIKEQSLTISSAFPYVEKDGIKIPFFPKPILPQDLEKPDEEWSFKKKCEWMAERKKEKKANTFLSKTAFEQLIKGEKKRNELPDTEKAPVLKSELITRNKIDRIKGGTYKEGNKAGQLFHIDQYHFEGFEDSENAGLFFLAKGNTQKLEGALRYLSHVGMGGDRSTGKGFFDISMDDFFLEEPELGNTFTNLSLYCPAEDELNFFQKNNQLFNYQLEERKGLLSFMIFKNAQKSPLLFFKEASVFPWLGKDVIGKIQTVKTVQSLSYPVYHYGLGFMVKMNLQN